MAEDIAVKADRKLVGEIERFVKNNRFVYSSIKQVVNLAIIEFLKEHSIGSISKEVNHAGR